MTTLSTLAAHLIRRDAIDPSSTNPRKRFDEQGLRDLAATMGNGVGIIEPLVVRLGKKAGRYELVAGERRWRAAAIAGLDDVPVVVRELTDEQVIEIQIIENEKRNDIHALEQSDAFVAWIKLNPRLTPKLLAERIGMSERFVQNLLHYQKLAPEVREAFYDNKITAGHADLIVRLAPEVQVKALAACFERDYQTEHELKAAGGGLFADERETTVGKQTAVIRTVSVRGLDDWIKGNVRLDVTPGADETRFFPEIREALTPKPIAGAESVKGAPVILQVADTYEYHPAKGEKPPFPLSSQQWEEVKGKKCEFAQRAVVVLGSRRGRLLDVCTAKGKCKAHWEWTIQEEPKPRAAVTGASADAGAKARMAKKRHDDAQARERVKQQRIDLVWNRVLEDIAPKVAPNTPSPALLKLIDWNAGGAGRIKSWRDVVAHELEHVGSYSLSRKDVFAKVARIIKPLGIDLVKLVAEEERSEAVLKAGPKKPNTGSAAKKASIVRKPKRKAGRKK